MNPVSRLALWWLRREGLMPPAARRTTIPPTVIVELDERRAKADMYEKRLRAANLDYEADLMRRRPGV